VRGFAPNQAADRIPRPAGRSVKWHDRIGNSMGGMSISSGAGDLPTADQVTQALASVNDPEIHRPITELGMVKNVEVSPDGTVVVQVWLTVAGCPLRDTITRDVTAAVTRVSGVAAVRVELDVMSDEQRRALQGRLRGGAPEKEIPFAKPSSLTKVYAIASGKGGVGKSSVTVNLAVAMAATGLKVGLLDADIYGHSVPRMLGVTARPTQVEQMIMPPSVHGVAAISSGMLKKGNEPLPLRGPILHRLLTQFLADVYWGDLDVLLMDLPPGTGDVAISAAHLVPGSELIVVTTPQLASAEVAERAGSLANQLHQRVAGVIENMSYLPCPHCGERVEVFGAGGGQAVADTLTRLTGAPVPVLGEVPIDTRLREAGDSGLPLVLGHPDTPAAQELRKIAENLAGRSRSLAGRQLGLSPV
jgi:ATP-binding protein involved in chromosome partitioning